MCQVEWIERQFKQMFILILLSLPVLAFAQQEEGEFRPATVLYKLNANATPSQLKGLNALLRSHGLVSERTLVGSQVVIATFEHAGREKAIAKILDKSGYVEFAEPDYVVAPTKTPSDSFFNDQWHHDNVNSELAWDLVTGSHTVLVGVCDTGFDVTHPDLADNLITSLAYNAQDDSDYIFDANGHGTGSAGTLGAVGNNARGVAGANWDVGIIPVRIAISDSNSSAYISTMATCIEYAADNGARIVNLSYGGIQYATIDSAAQYLRANGGLLFMSAGNSGQEHNYPDYTSFIGVGATDRNDNRASFSSWGNYVDITAPGVEILTTYPSDRYVYYSGTSFSSPLTAGIAALMVAANPAITPDEIETGLFSTAVDIGAVGDDSVFGHGLVDAFAAVSYALNLNNLNPPVASFTAAPNPVAYNAPVVFDGSASSDVEEGALNYVWDFGDGNSSQGMGLGNVLHTYMQAGSFQVSLTVTDSDGLSDTETMIVQSTTDLPSASISVSPDQASYGLNASIDFTGNAMDIDGFIAHYEWDFGDGTSQGTDVEGDLATIDDVTTKSYSSPGNYSVFFTVTDDAGAMNSASVEITVVDQFVLTAPNLSASVDGMAVTLTWDDQANETGYRVERGVKRRGKVDFNLIKGLAQDASTYTDNLTEPGTYSYRVIAENNVNSATSNTVRVTVDSTVSEPEPGDFPAPTNLQVTRSGDSALLNWSYDASVAVAGFIVERGLKRKGQISFSPIPSDGTILPGNNYEDSEFGSLPNGNYAYRVQAINEAGETSAFSNVAEIRKK